VSRISRARKNEIRNKILDTAYSHFQTSGYDHTNTREITQESGIAEGTLYNYFPDKATLFLEAMTTRFVPVISQTNSCTSLIDLGQFLTDKLQIFFSFPKETMRRIVVIFLDLSAKESPVVKRLVLLDELFLKELKVLFDFWVEKGIMKTCDTDMVSSIVFATLIYEMMNYLFDDNRSEKALSEAVQRKVDFFLKGWMIPSQVQQHPKRQSFL